MNKLDNIPNDYLGSKHTCLLKEETGELIDTWDFEPILIGTPIVTIDGECMKRDNFIDYLEEKYPEVFSVYKGGK